jgi:amino-acid N-acetyltransferase
MLDPTQLRWSQFWVIECSGQIVACGQLRSFAGAQELGSLVVAPAWRDRGLGSYLTRHLIAQATEPLYIECLGSKLAKFYSRFGFTPVAWQELPPPLKWKFGLTQLAAKLIPIISVKVMQYRGKLE